MKTIREYLDLIKENEQPSWQEIVAEVVKKYGLPKKVYCGIRYDEYNTYFTDYIGRDGKKYTLYTNLKTYGTGQAVSYDKFPQDHTALTWLYGPDIAFMEQGTEEDFEPGYTDTASLCSLIEMYCLSDSPDINRIYYDVDSYYHKTCDIVDCETNEKDVDGTAVLKQFSSELGLDWESTYLKDLMSQLSMNENRNDRIISSDEESEDMERGVNLPMGGAYVEWTGMTLEFDKQGNNVVLVDSENVLSKIMTPAEKSPTTKTKRPTAQLKNNLPTNNSQNGEIQP